ncbi:unnamed protein product [Schistocephalus solidus]|uniref:Alpha/beta hydrolase n=1 Tax=Schistocephalus solidus TaxID=70667 RepID=A0A183TR90_SCHSO|nr:unnamed protein product [Schistocephalus solidus]
MWEEVREPDISRVEAHTTQENLTWFSTSVMTVAHGMTPSFARKLVHYKGDIDALSETRFSEQRQLEEVGAGYTVFWSGHPKAERHDAAVTFAIRNDIVGRLPWLP